MTVKSVTIKNLIPAAKLDAAIQKNGVTLANAQMETHRIACSVLQALGTSRDVRIVHKLLSSMTDMVRSNGLRNWIETFAPVSITQNEAGDDIVTFLKDKATGPGNGVKLQAAIDKPFWKFSAKEGKPYEPMKVETAIGQLINRLEKDAKELGDKVDHSALIAGLKALKVKPAVDAATAPAAPVDPLAA